METKENVIEIDVEEVEVKEPSRMEKFKEAVAAQTKKAAQWTRDNMDIIKVMAPVVLAVGGGMLKIGFKIASKDRARREKDLKELYCYDKSLGHYWKLDHALSTKEWKEVNDRKRHGESLGDILWDMDALE